MVETAFITGVMPILVSIEYILRGKVETPVPAVKNVIMKSSKLKVNANIAAEIIAG